MSLKRWALAGCRSPDPDPGSVITEPRFVGEAPSNLLMISIDTLRKDHMGRYGGTGLTPFLDQIAAQGVALDDHMTCSNWTLDATTCTLIGAFPSEVGVIPELVEGQIARGVPGGTPMLASWLGWSGFHSVLASSNALLSHVYNNAQGFDEVYLAPKAGLTPALDVAEVGIATLQAADPERWYLHLHLMEPHQPYVPPDSYLQGLDALAPIEQDLTTKAGHNAALVASTEMTPEEVALLTQHMQLRYAGEVAWLDAQLSQIWASLDREGLLDDTLVVFWTAHGAAFFERGYQTHAWTLFGEENDGVALFWADNIEPQAWTGPTSSTDLVPTILRVFELPRPHRVTGLALGDAPDDRARFASAAGKMGVVQSVRQGTDKLHFAWGDEAWVDFGDGRGIHWFDVAADPQEAVDRYDKSDPTVVRLWELLLPRIDENAALMPDRAITWPEGLPTR